MNNYLFRLDDASDYMDIEKWNRIESILDRYGIKPIFGIIPQNADVTLVSKYARNEDFWSLMHSWIEKGWTPAMHGYEHRYVTEEGGINPVNKRSEFAGLPYEIQAEKIRKGYTILEKNGIHPTIFFAPSHTFDENTLKALKNQTPIRIISDTIAWDIYKTGEFWFIPQQSGRVRKLPFKTVTFCYHPNTMSSDSFMKLEYFLRSNKEHFCSPQNLKYIDRQKSLFDILLQKTYLSMH